MGHSHFDDASREGCGLERWLTGGYAPSAKSFDTSSHTPETAHMRRVLRDRDDFLVEGRALAT
jgi:hypothetical protein